MSTTNNKPYVIVGAGELVSHVRRTAVEAGVMSYYFNLFRLQLDGEASQLFRPRDLIDIVKACQVLAFTIADDGWVSNDLRRELLTLADDLDAVTQRKAD